MIKFVNGHWYIRIWRKPEIYYHTNTLSGVLVGLGLWLWLRWGARRAE